MDKFFKIHSPYEPSGDQPQAIQELVKGINNNKRDQVLLGVTGSGKTFTMAKIIESVQKPTLIIAHNKTLAAQLFSEFKGFFPENAVEYFVSYYDYYMPESYIPHSDTYIAKESTINDRIDQMRHSTTRSLIERRDVIVVASVSCIYGLGSKDFYENMTFTVRLNQRIKPQELSLQLVNLQYDRNNIQFKRGTFRINGDNFDIWPSHLEKEAWRLSFFDDEVDRIIAFDPLTGTTLYKLESLTLFANTHFIADKNAVNKAIQEIQVDLQIRYKEFKDMGKLVEAERLLQRINHDIEMLTTTGFCQGIENYSRYFSGRMPGEAPPTLFEYFPSDSLLFVDESHVTVSQIGAMYKGDQSRKQTLADFGFRLPSCKDNRPLNFEEWNQSRSQTVYVSATPGDYELNLTQGEFVEQIIRPTGLLDPIIEVREATQQVKDLVEECFKVVANGGRVLAVTLTKKMAEELHKFMLEKGIKCRYMHADVETLDRIALIKGLKEGVYDVLIGINLLREGLDIPQCQLVAVLDADKEGFLRSYRSLIQMIGRAARNNEGRVILYADRLNLTLQKAIEETNRRRKLQEDYNRKHNITPKTTTNSDAKHLAFLMQGDTIATKEADWNLDNEALFIEQYKQTIKTQKQLEQLVAKLTKAMKHHAKEMEYEEAKKIRDILRVVEMIGVPEDET